MSVAGFCLHPERDFCKADGSQLLLGNQAVLFTHFASCKGELATLCHSWENPSLPSSVHYLLFCSELPLYFAFVVSLCVREKPYVIPTSLVSKPPIEFWTFDHKNLSLWTCGFFFLRGGLVDMGLGSFPADSAGHSEVKTDWRSLSCFH